MKSRIQIKLNKIGIAKLVIHWCMKTCFFFVKKFSTVCLGSLRVLQVALKLLNKSYIKKCKRGSLQVLGMLNLSGSDLT